MVDYLMVGEIRPELPERELPAVVFGFAVVVLLLDPARSLMIRDELTGLVDDAGLMAAGSRAGVWPSFEMP